MSKIVVGSIYGNNTFDMDVSEKSQTSHLSLEEMINQSLSKIEGVMGEILNESSASNRLKAKLIQRKSKRDIMAEIEEDEEPLAKPPRLDSLQAELVNADKQHYKKSVMYNVEKIAIELEETRKSEEELKGKIDALRSRLAQRRALRNRITNASKVVQGTDNRLSRNHKYDTAAENREPIQEEKKEEEKENQTMIRKTNIKKKWFSFFKRKDKRDSHDSTASVDMTSVTSLDSDDIVTKM